MGCGLVSSAAASALPGASQAQAASELRVRTETQKACFPLAAHSDAREWLLLSPMELPSELWPLLSLPIALTLSPPCPSAFVGRLSPGGASLDPEELHFRAQVEVSELSDRLITSSHE